MAAQASGHFAFLAVLVVTLTISMSIYQTAVSYLKPLLEALDPNAKLVVGVSGGADSLALLHLLCRAVGENRLIVGHLNHGLRETAVSHAKHVRQITAKWQVPYAEQTTDVAAHAGQHKLSIEAAGRDLRYQFLAEVAAQHGAEAILTAHHANDQAETVLLHLLRGSGLDGLRGMQPLGPLHCAPELWHGRPFLTINRSAIEAYCHENEISWVEDETNQDPRFLRNRLRHDLLPLLGELNPAIVQHLNTLTEIIAADADYLDDMTQLAWEQVCRSENDEAVCLSREAWLGQPLALQRRLVRRAARAVQEKTAEISFRVVEDARLHLEMGSTGTRLDLPGQVTLHVSYEQLVFTRAPATFLVEDFPQLASDLTQRLPIPGRLSLANGWQLVASFISSANPEAIWQNENVWCAHVVSEVDSLIVRPRMPGEKLQPLGLNGRSTSLKKLMINRKISASLRARWPIVSTADHLVWVVGHQLDQRTAVTSPSSRIIQLRCLPPDSDKHL